MTLTQNGYIPRIIDSKVAEYLKLFGAVSIEGPKWCGKTWTSLNHASSVTYIMDPAGNYSNRERARINPALILGGDRPHAIDEWQEVPGIWDAVRFEVDQGLALGQFILTGSITPPRESFAHSGSGRIGTIRMSPMSLSESGDSTRALSLQALICGEAFEPIVADIELPDLIDITIRGGWPQALSLPIRKSGTVSEEYLKAIARNELFREGAPQRNPKKLNKLLRSLARNTSTIAGRSTLSADIDDSDQEEQANEEATLSRETVGVYLEDLMRIFLIDEIPAWNPDLRSKVRIRSAPKRIFCDPSLAVAALGAGQGQLLQDLKTFGFLFENLVFRDLMVYAEALDATIFHYRDESGLEADVIMEMADGTWCAFEVKLGAHQADAAAKSLIKLKTKMVANGIAAPVLMGVITGGGIGMLRDDGVYVLPINALTI